MGDTCWNRLSNMQGCKNQIFKPRVPSPVQLQHTVSKRKMRNPYLVPVGKTRRLCNPDFDLLSLTKLRTLAHSVGFFLSLCFVFFSHKRSARVSLFTNPSRLKQSLQVKIQQEIHSKGQSNLSFYLLIVFSSPLHYLSLYPETLISGCGDLQVEDQSLSLNGDSINVITLLLALLSSFLTKCSNP